MHNKKSNCIVDSNQLFEGFPFLNTLYLRGSQIVTIVGKDDVKWLKMLQKSNEQKFNKILQKAHPYVKDIVEGRIHVPAIIYLNVI